MPLCQICGSENVQKRGYLSTGKQRLKCNECGGWSSVLLTKEETTEYPKKIAAKILLFDIETLPMEVYVWDLQPPKYISPDNVIKDYSVVCWSAKWLFEPDVMGAKVSGTDAIRREDCSILQEMWSLLDQADIVVVQNGKRFDIPKLNTRFIKAGFPPPMYYQVVDTKEIMTKNFGFSSNKLDYVNKFLGIEGKTEMVWEDWVECVRGNEEYIQKMLNYNKDDVVIMEELYLKLRPWIPAHANLGVFADVDKDCCPNCQSTELKWTGQYVTPLGMYSAFRCSSCGSIGRSTKKKYKMNGVDVRN